MMMMMLRTTTTQSQSQFTIYPKAIGQYNLHNIHRAKKEKLTIQFKPKRKRKKPTNHIFFPIVKLLILSSKISVKHFLQSSCCTREGDDEDEGEEEDTGIVEARISLGVAGGEAGSTSTTFRTALPDKTFCT